MVLGLREDAGPPVLVGGIAVAVLGVAVTIYGQSRWRRWKGMHQAYEQVFIDGKLTDRLHYTVQRHNRQVAKACGYKALMVPSP